MPSHSDNRGALPTEPTPTPQTATLHVPGVHTLLDVRLRTSAAGRDLTMVEYVDALDRLHAALLFAAIRPDMHSTVSDGSLPVRELVHAVHAAGVAAFVPQPRGPRRGLT